MPLTSGPSEQPSCPNCSEPYDVTHLRWQWSLPQLEDGGGTLHCEKCGQWYLVKAIVCYTTKALPERKTP